jgi:hypothetical protein
MTSTVISIVISCVFAVWLLLYGDRIKKKFVQRRITTLENLLDRNEHYFGNLLVLGLTGLALIVATLFFGFSIALVVYLSWPVKASIPFYDTITRYLILTYLTMGAMAWWMMFRELQHIVVDRDKVKKQLEDLKLEIPKPGA